MITTAPDVTARGYLRAEFEVPKDLASAATIKSANRVLRPLTHIAILFTQVHCSRIADGIHLAHDVHIQLEGWLCPDMSRIRRKCHLSVTFARVLISKLSLLDVLSSSIQEIAYVKRLVLYSGTFSRDGVGQHHIPTGLSAKK